MVEHEWELAGAEGEPILGIRHEPEGQPQGVVIVCHGFKGYMDYGMFPRFARELTEVGFVVHRFNFSHSGVTREFESFARPELFERDTWSKQVHDLRRVMSAVRDGEIGGEGLGMVVFGHSRGGATALLTAGLDARDRVGAAPNGLIVAAAPSACCSMDEPTRATLLEEGSLASPSARTGQVLRVGKRWLEEQIERPADHDLLALAARIDSPVLVVHGTDDQTVPVSAADDLRRAIGARARIQRIDNGDHVFITPNPLPDEAPMNPQLQALVETSVEFVRGVCGATEQSFG